MAEPAKPIIIQDPAVEVQQDNHIHEDLKAVKRPLNDEERSAKIKQTVLVISICTFAIIAVIVVWALGIYQNQNLKSKIRSLEKEIEVAQAKNSEGIVLIEKKFTMGKISEYALEFDWVKIPNTGGNQFSRTAQNTLE